MLSQIFYVLAHESNSPHEDMPLYPDTLFWLWANPSLLLLLNAVCLVEKQQIPILMSFVWPRWWWIPWPSTFKASTLTVTPLRQIEIIQIKKEKNITDCMTKQSAFIYLYSKIKYFWIIIFQFYDLSYFMVILMVFVMSYSIAAYSILYPNSSLSGDFIMNLLRMGYWNLYGELFIDEIECKFWCVSYVYMMNCCDLFKEIIILYHCYIHLLNNSLKVIS